MRLVVLTTETPHHAHFVRTLSESFPVELVMVETEAVSAPFQTTHAFEAERDVYEKGAWFGGGEVSLSTFAPTCTVGRINQPDAVQKLRETDPDVIVVFGTAKLSEEVIDVCPDGIVNLHGGDPEEYRGLDTHLWAIYHGDYGALITTLHRLNAELDDGEIIQRLPVPVKAGMRLHELRKVNTEVCIQLVTTALQAFGGAGAFTSTPQRHRGRYYSFMPTVLKQVCLRRFERHTRHG